MSPTPSVVGDELEEAYASLAPWMQRLPSLYGIGLGSDTSALPPVHSYDTKMLYRTLGGADHEQPTEIEDNPMHRLVAAFRSAMTKSTPLDTAMRWDMAPLDQALRDNIKKHVVTLDEAYAISLPRSHEPALHIVVYDPELVLFVCRQPSLTFEHAAVELYKIGARFNACVESSRPPDALPSVQTAVAPPPKYSSDTELGQEVYTSYVSARHRLLYGPRRRAALLCGGLISRIAQDAIKCDKVKILLQPPSSTVTLCRDNYVGTLGDGRYLYDEQLQEVEKDHILGVLYVMQGSADCLMYSWWPRATLLRNPASTYYWFWDDSNEHWYTKRVATLDEAPSPIARLVWKNKGRPGNPFRQFVSGYKARCAEVLSLIL